MNPIVIFSVCLVLATFTACSGRPAEPPTVGKYSVSKSNNDDGKYRPVKRNEGRYIHMVQPYVHVHDNRELGQYVHIPNPYDGGYGPYSGLNNPYRHDESGNYDKYTVSNAEFEIPAIRLEYGFPDHDPVGTSSTTTRRPTTTTTTTIKPRLFNYYEEGGWKILRQEEEKKKHKYDFLYHTENGIYGEEKAHLHPGAGTSATGYYEYTGDDGELYRVNYKSDHNGFIPEGDHIPTPPPVPDAIKRALEYVAKKKETHGAVQSGRYEHKSDPIRLQNMPTIDRPLTPTQQPRALPTLPTLPSFSRPLTQQPLAQPQPLPQQPRALPPLPALSALPALPALPTLAPIAAQPRFVQYSANNQYNPLPTIAPQNAPIQAYQAPSLSSKRPADQLIQQTQLNQLDQLPQVQVALPPVQAPKPVEIPKPVQVIEITTPAPIQEVIKVAEPAPMPELKPAEEQPQSDQPQADQPQADQPQPQLQQSEPEQLPKEEVLIKEEPSAGENLKTEQSIESIVIVKPDSASDVEAAPKTQEISPEASETDNQFQPPYQVPEQLTNEDNFELTMA